MEELKTTLTHESDNTWILALNGTVDSTTQDSVWPDNDILTLLDNLVESGSERLVIDLTTVDRCDSHGLRLFLDAHRILSAKDIQIVLRNPNSHLQRLFRIMEFDRVFIIDS